MQRTSDPGSPYDTAELTVGPNAGIALNHGANQHWLMRHPLYQGPMRDIIQAVRAVRSKWLTEIQESDATIAAIVLGTHGLWCLEKPQGVRAVASFFFRFLCMYSQVHYRTEFMRRQLLWRPQIEPADLLNEAYTATTAVAPKLTPSLSTSQRGEGGAHVE